MVKNIVLEVCAFNIQSCIVAEKAGAHRVELCDNPVEGGTTSSFGVIRQTRAKVSIEIYPIIRPRAGDFVYDDNELMIMKHDILLCKEIGCEGISVGVQKANGEIDIEQLSRIVEWAYPMGVTCHRVFDRTPDPFKALEDVIAAGCERILTSGQKTTAAEATDILAKLVQQAEGRIIIMPGAGVRSANIEKLIRETGAREFHTSAKTIAPPTVTYHNPLMNDTGEMILAGEEELRKILQVGKDVATSLASA
jgi:copper homeostasis protein